MWREGSGQGGRGGRGGSIRASCARVFAGENACFLARILGSRGCNAFLFSSFNFAFDFVRDTLHGAQVLSFLLAGLDGFARKKKSTCV